MSAANAAAIRRRVSNQNAPPPVPTTTTKNTTNQNVQNKGMTLPQVINSLDQRIKTIEETFSNTSNDIMKLQSFTMEVNKSLYDDRIRIMSDNINVADTNLIHQIQEANSEPIHQIQDANSETIHQTNTDLNTTSADLKTMVEEEISSSNDI